MSKKNYPRPLVAVLVSNDSISNLQKQIAYPQIRLLVSVNEEVKTTLFFFSIRDVKLREQRIRGYYWYNKGKKWLCQDFPFPDILYIRCEIDRKYNQFLTEICKKVTSNNGKLLTHFRFNKWRLYQVMSKDPVMKKYLPATLTVNEPHVIEKMLQSHRVIYLKSHIGRKGENVIRVETQPGKGYQYSYYRLGELTVRSVSNFQSLLDIVNKFYRGRHFLIQQGIELLKFNDRLTDMRAEIQRNGNGDLEIAGICLRQGPLGSPITTHGDAYKYDDFFTKKLGYSEEQLEALRSDVHQFLTLVYRFLENNYGKYAELGIDFAIDENNKIWFIEANARSTKVSLHKAYGKAVLYKNSKTILEYCRYLFKQADKRSVNDYERKHTEPRSAAKSRREPIRLQSYHHYSQHKLLIEDRPNNLFGDILNNKVVVTPDLPIN